MIDMLFPEIFSCLIEWDLLVQCGSIQWDQYYILELSKLDVIILA